MCAKPTPNFESLAVPLRSEEAGREFQFSAETERKRITKQFSVENEK